MLRRLISVFLLCLAVSGCATQSYYRSEKLGRSQPRILVMPPDIELSELTVGGSLELNALWTQSGYANVEAALRQHLVANKAVFVDYKAPPEDTPEFEQFDQLQRLHRAVGANIKLYQIAANARLPAKEGKFDWSLGPAAGVLGRPSQSNYALFLFVRDSYSTPGRVALQIAAAMLNVHLAGGSQAGYASLVDLNNGEVVWFNALSREAGDLRTLDPAKETVALLLDNMPK
jgi:hypothetical protein